MLLFLMFGSVLVPIKALVLNVLSLTATFGAMVWIFQDGNLSGLLDFTATGRARRRHADPDVLHRLRPVDGLRGVPAVPHQGGARPHAATTTTSVAVGLERTGRIVTAAAAAARGRCSSPSPRRGVTFIKLFGLGLALAVLMDAFVIRATLVPAFMRLAGEANWWAPAPLRRFHERWGPREGEHVGPAAEPTGAVKPDEPSRTVTGTPGR